MSIIIDTGFLYATVDSSDKHHQVATSTLRFVRNEILVLPTPTVVELGILMNSRLGQQATAKFVSRLETSPLRLAHLESQDFARIGELLLQYQDARLDFVDAAITTLAERLNIRQILTVDRRDFSMIRPKHCPYFELIP